MHCDESYRPVGVTTPLPEHPVGEQASHPKPGGRQGSWFFVPCSLFLVLCWPGTFSCVP